MSKQKNIRVIATKLTGSLHLSKNKTCQDYFKYDINNDRIIAIVSDGAGSAQYGKIGAKVICEAIVNNLINSKTKNLKKDIKQSINNARDKLIKHRLNKSKTDTEISLFSATFVGVVYEKNSGFFFHIGDGAGIAVHDDNCHSYTISSPMNGQYSCETFFYTMPNWEDYLRFTPFNSSTCLLLMTDGLTSFALNKDSNCLQKGFIEPINNYLINEQNHQKALLALNNTLDSEQAKHLNSDDKTFIWIRPNNE